MTRHRYVALGLAPARSEWFTEVARWATTAVLPLEFVKCLASEEAHARLESGRRYSALLVDGGLPGLERDLLDQARAQGCAVIVIDDDPPRRDWFALGALAVLPPSFGREQLIAALDEHAHAVRDPAARAVDGGSDVAPSWQGTLVTVVGGGGTGSSTMSLALAQGMAADPRDRGTVLLADLALRADQAMLHDARELVPGLPELVEAHRVGTPTPGEVAQLTFEVRTRGYRLLLGLRRPRDWAALRPRALEAGLRTLRSSHRVVVADADADLEGEAECGSIEVEERNLLARTAVGHADLVVAVGGPDLTGTHRLRQILSALLDHGVPPARILPVVNRAPRSPKARAARAAALAGLLRATHDHAPPIAGPIFVPERRRLDDTLVDGRSLPAALTDPLTRGVLAGLDHAARHAPHRDTAPEPIAPGSLGSWTLEAEAG